ncbi:hypothetical protein M0Q39_05970 [Patescibacteria group bacterium]|nr:hypothetical protein [Patescibacteria group bacterium]
MRNLVHQMTYQPKIILWLVFFFFAFICTVIPFLGPAFLGFIIYRIIKMGEVQRLADAYIPTVLGIIGHSLIFHLPSWPLENFVIVTFFNILCFAAGGVWVRFLS